MTTHAIVSVAHRFVPHRFAPHRLRLVAMVGLLVSCTPTPALPTVTQSRASPGPTISTAAPDSVEPAVATASPTSTASAPRQAVPSASGSLVPSTATATDTPFVRVGDFPADGDWIAAIATGDPGFVAVGASQVVHPGPGTPCRGDYDGRIWTSPDGKLWTRQPVDLDKVPLSHVIEFDGLLYAFGRPGDACDVRGGYGYSVWRSADGMNWSLGAEEVGAPYGAIFDVVATESRVIALGWDSGRFAQAWLSLDGSSWSVPEVPPTGASRGAALGETVIAWRSSDQKVAGLHIDVSHDAGATWEQVFVDLSLDATYDFYPHFAVSHGTLAVMARTCCVSGVAVSIPITTSDGRAWSVGDTLASPSDELLGLPSGFVSFSRDDGRTLVSSDGLSWFDGPVLPPSDGGAFALVAGGAPGVVVVPNAAGRRDRWVHVAPSQMFDPAEWTNPARVLST